MTHPPLGRLAFWMILGGGASVLLVASRPDRRPGPDLALAYTVRPSPGEGFEVEVRVRGLRGRSPSFRLLDGWGLLQNQSAHVESVKASDASGRRVPVERVPGRGETGWRLRGRPRGEMVLRYRVRSYDPLSSPEATFCSSANFLLLGYSAFLLPRGVGTLAPVPIRVRVEPPRGWPVWASWPGERGEYTVATPHDLWSGVIAGGSYRAVGIRSGTVGVEVLTGAGVPDQWGTAMANRLFPVLREMVTTFGAPPRGDSLRVLAVARAAPGPENRGSVSGNSEEGSFLCLAAPDRLRDPASLTVVAVHECLHFYLGGAFTASAEPPFRNAPGLIWLMEGVTEYLTYRLLARSGVMTEAEVERAAREKERTLREEETHSRVSLAEAARRMEEPAVYERVYTRGYLVAELLDRRMTALGGPGAFEGALRDLFERYDYYRGGSLLTPAEVRGVFEARAPGIGAILSRYADGDAPLPPREGEWATAAR